MLDLVFVVFMHAIFSFQGVKVSISASSVPSVSSLDRDVLHLTWTRERLQQQLDVIDRRCEA